MEVLFKDSHRYHVCQFDSRVCTKLEMCESILLCV